MTVWRVAVDENGGNASYNEFKVRKVVAIGWRELGSFAHLVGQPRPVIEKHAHAEGDLVYAPTPTNLQHWWFGTPQGHPNPYGGHRTHIGRIFDYFINQITPGDLVLAHVGISSVGITEVCESSKYYYDPSYEYANCWKPVKWTDLTEVKVTVSTCRFLGICKVNRAEAQRIIQDWNDYKARANFQPC